jgi:N-carbamoyl-L-amino-acid hydrolase
VIGTGAGHDAGILSAAGVPTAMLFVRNPTGISHSPAEFAEEVDCDAGVRALTAVLASLLTEPSLPEALGTEAPGTEADRPASPRPL